MATDLVTYLPDDILTKVDRAAMSVGLETRIPFLDPRVVEFAWSLPKSMKERSGRTKWITRTVLAKYVPRHLFDRPKRGFGIPISDWLRGPLRDWAEDLLSVYRLRSEGYFREEVIQEKWRQHLSGEGNWPYELWDVLMFESWLRASKARGVVEPAGRRIAG